MWGGERDNGPLDDLWIITRPSTSAAGEAHQQQQQQAAQPLPSSVRWMQLKGKVAPTPRFGHSMVGESQHRTAEAGPDAIQNVQSPVAYNCMHRNMTSIMAEVFPYDRTLGASYHV